MRILELDGKRFLLIHGHIQSVKYKTQELEALAKIEKSRLLYIWAYAYSRYKN